MDALRKCPNPWCESHEGDARLSPRVRPSSGPNPIYRVDCRGCCSHGPWQDTVSEAIAAWNTRPETDRLVEALEECVAVLTADTVGTIRMDDPNWYAALDKAVTKARAALTAAKGTDT